MKHHIALFLLVATTLLTGCGGRIGMRQLEQLEAQLDTAPHLVLQALDSIPVAKLRGEKRALYAILKTQADYKCYRPLTTDTLIRYATTYYDDDRKSYRAAMAWYSLGCVYSELQDDAAAIDAYLQAQSLFPDTTVRYYRLCYQNLGDHYIHKNMADEALAAYQSYRLLSEGYDQVYADIKLAQAYIRKRMPHQAQAILENLLLHREQIDRVSLRTILFELGKIEHAFNKDYAKADDYFDQLIALYDEGKIDAAHWFKGNIAEHRGDTARAIHYYKATMQGNDNAYLLYNSVRSLLYLAIDSTSQPELHGYARLFEQMGDTIDRIERRAEIDEIHTAHAMELHQRELSERHRRFIHYTALFVVCLLAAIAIAALWVEQHRKQYYFRLQQELQRNQAEVYKMYESIDTKRDNGSLAREQVLALYRSNLAKSIALFGKEEWAARLRKLSTLRSKDVPPFTVKERNQLTEVLERNFITVITNLRDEAEANGSKLSIEDTHLCLLLALGCSTGVIRECMAASTDNVVNQRKKRLLGKLPEDILVILTESHK